MKLQAAYIFVVASLAAASPLIDVTVRTSSASAAKVAPGLRSGEVCWLVCWPEKPLCPDTMVRCPFIYINHLLGSGVAHNLPKCKKKLAENFSLGTYKSQGEETTPSVFQPHHKLHR
jgi:hypothetical protein